MNLFSKWTWIFYFFFAERERRWRKKGIIDDIEFLDKISWFYPISKEFLWLLMLLLVLNGSCLKILKLIQWCVNIFVFVMFAQKSQIASLLLEWCYSEWYKTLMFCGSCQIFIVRVIFDITSNIAVIEHDFLISSTIVQIISFHIRNRFILEVKIFNMTSGYDRRLAL